MPIQRRLIIALWVFFAPVTALYAGAVENVAVDKPQILRQDSVTKGYEPLAIGEQTIAAAYLPQTLGTPRGAVLLLHDLNEHIDSAAIGSLRRQLPEHGWNTLAIKIIRFNEDSDAKEPAVNIEDTTAAAEDAQADPAETPPAEAPPPVAGEEATAAESPETTEPAEQVYTAITTPQRIDAALLKLQQEGHENIVLIGQGAGGELALKTLKATAVPIAALIMINTAELSEGVSIADVEIPTLEIVGSRQQDAIKQAILKRQVAIKTAQKTNYQLRQIIGADHYFSSVPLQIQLTNQVHGWLYKQLFDQEEPR